MKTEEEKIIKAYLFKVWKKYKSPKFFLAGAVIGKVADIYALASQYGIDAQIVKNFCRRFEVDSPINDINKVVVIRSIYRQLHNWYCYGGKFDDDFPQDIYAILSKAKDEKVRLGDMGELEIEDKPQYEFTTAVFVPPVKNKVEIKKSNNEVIRDIELERDIERHLVSKSESAKAYERCIRMLYDGKYLALTFRTKNNKEAMLETVNDEVNYLFADETRSAATPEEFYSVWKFLKFKQIDLDEILEGVKAQKVDEFEEIGRKSRGLETFFEFLINFKKARAEELIDFEVKAQIWGIDLKKMLSEEILSLCDYDTATDEVYEKSSGELLTNIRFSDINLELVTA